MASLHARLKELRLPMSADVIRCFSIQDDRTEKMIKNTTLYIMGYVQDDDDESERAVEQNASTR